MSVAKSEEKFLLTGSMGCIGAWVLRHLVDEGVSVVATDLSSDPVRPRLLLSEDEINSITWQQLDVTDAEAVNRVAAENGVNRIVHLAGMQIPFCKANPSLGAAVNVQGTVNIFEAARANNIRGVTYASSAAAFGPPELYQETPIRDDAPLLSTTLYGVYKAANERTAQVYWDDWQVGTVGLRPYNVYGVGRDQGLTSDVAKAILATAAGKPFNIRYNGPITLQHAKDVAAMFIGCARAEHQGAIVGNLRNDVTSIEGFIDVLKQVAPAASVTCEENLLPFPADYDDSNLRGILGTVPHTPLDTAIAEDLALYKSLIDRNGIDMAQLDQ